MEEQLVQRIKCHPAFERLGNLDLPGFTLPKGNFSRYNPDDTHDKRTLATFGIRVSGSLGGNSEVYVEPAMAGANLELRGIGLGGNVVVLSPKCRIKGSIVFEGTKHIFIAGGCPTSSNVAAVFRTEECGIFLGEETSFGGAAFWAEGPKVGIFVGDGSMVSWDVNLRTSDGHGIVDLLTMSKCNEHKSVIIRPHVWLGMGVTVCPGTARLREALDTLAKLIFRDVAVRLLRAVFDDHPVIYSLDKIEEEMEFHQAASLEALPSPAESLLLYVGFPGGNSRLDFIRESHEMAEFGPSGKSRWTFEGASDLGSLAKQEGLSIGEAEFGNLDIVVVSPGLVHRVSGSSRAPVLAAFATPRRITPLRFLSGSDSWVEVNHVSGARIRI